MDEQTKSVIEGAREFLRQREDYKARLRTELEQAKARVAEIESVLLELDGGAPEAKAQVLTMEQRKSLVATARRQMATEMTIPERILAIVRAAPAGMSSGDIVNAVFDKHGTPKTTTYPTIYRMEKDGRLKKKGEVFLPGD